MPGPDLSCSAATTAAGLAKLAFCVFLLHQWLPRPEKQVAFLPSLSALFLQAGLRRGTARFGVAFQPWTLLRWAANIISFVPDQPVIVLAMYLQAIPCCG